MNLDLKNMGLVDLLFLLEVKKIKFPIYKDLVDNCNYDEVYEQINVFYKKETGISISTLDDDGKHTLYEFAKNKERYHLLNDLLIIFVNNLCFKKKASGETVDSPDLFVINNLNQLITIIIQQHLDLLLSSYFSSCCFSKLEKDKRENLITEFLIEIDPTMEWLNIYRRAKNSGKIIYLNECSEEEKRNLSKRFGIDFEFSKNCCIKTEDGESYMFVDCVGNISDVVSIIHEFSHFVSLSGDELQPSLLEFPSLFYESYCLLFLEKKGYSKEELSDIRNSRNLNTSEVSSLTQTIFEYIKVILDNNSLLTEEVDLAMMKDNFKKVEKFMTEEDRQLIFSYLDFKKFIYDKCDECIEFFILYGQNANKIYSYVMGKYLTDTAIDRLNNGQSILPDIKNITENLSVDPYDVFKILGCDVEAMGLVSSDEKGANVQKVYSLFINNKA